MGTVAFYPQSLLSFNKKLNLRNPFFTRREIADWPCSSFALKKNPHKLTILSIGGGDDGGSRKDPIQPGKDSSTGRWKKGDGKVSSSSSSSTNQEEIIALFTRIKSSISKGGESGSKKKRNPRTSKDNVDVLLQPRKEVKGKDGQGLKWRRKVTKKDQKIQNKEPVGDFKLTRLPSNFVKRSPIPSPSAARGVVLEPKFKLTRLPSNFVKRSPIPTPSTAKGEVLELTFKLTRLPSNFVKRSPIPSPSTARKEVLELNSKASVNTPRNTQLKLPRMQELKLHELKELAKARGLKGYSRLKKSDLIKLLRS